MRYRVFGAVEVSGADTRALGRRRERNVLAVLLAAHGSPVPAERIVAEVWDEDAQALGALQVAVSRLRSALEPDRAARQPATRLVSTAGGYAVVAGVEDVDVWEFESLVDAALAPGDPATRLALAERAEELWTGDPYPDCDVETVRLERDRLTELRLTLHEVRGQAMLDLDRPEAAVLALGTLAPQHPYRERLWALLALAQYRCARQAESLETLRTLRERLADDLGVDPTPDVAELEQRVLRQDAGLTAVPERKGVVPAAPPPAPPAAAPAEDRDYPTVGREAALAVVTAAVDRVTSGSGGAGVLSVSGEPGIGKSRLVGELERLAGARGVRVALGRCQEGDFAPPLWPWLTIVRDLAGDAPDPLLLPLLDGVGSSGDAGAGTALRMYDAVVDLLGAAAAAGGLAVVLEDIHWADVSSLRLLTRVVELAPTGVLVVTTRRTTEMTAGEPLVEAMAALARSGGERLRLDGLDSASVSRLLHRLLGTHDPRLDRVVDEATNGNPFFVHEYARLLQARPDLRSVRPEDMPLPDGVRDVLRLRLARLPDKARTLLVDAAVLGRTIDPDTVAAMADEPVDEVLDLLDLGLASGLLEERGSTYAFAHALTRETVYHEVSAARRMRRHARAAALLEERVGENPDQAAAIAHHAAMAAPLGEEQTRIALVWLFRAAQVAQTRQAHVEALDLWRRARDTAASAHLDSQRLQAMSGEAETLLRLGQTTEASDVIDEVVEAARTLGRWDLVADAAAILTQGGVWSWREHGTKREEFIAVLTEALDHVDPVREARLCATLLMEHYYGWDSAVVDEYGARALGLAHEIDDPDLLREVLLPFIIALVGRARGEERTRLVEELLALEPQGELRLGALFNHGYALHEMARVEESDRVMAQCAAEARELRHSGVDIPLAWWAFARARDREDPGARALGMQALMLHRRSGYLAGWELEWHRAAYDPPVPSSVREAVLEGRPAVRATVAHAVLLDGDPATAYSLLGDPMPPHAADYSVIGSRCLRVAVLAVTGPEEELRTELDRLRPHEGLVSNYGSIDHLGAVDHFLALGEHALGDDEAALAHARSAVEMLRDLDNKPWLRRAEALLEELEASGSVAARKSAASARQGRSPSLGAMTRRHRGRTPRGTAMTTAYTGTEQTAEQTAEQATAPRTNAVDDLRRLVVGTLHTPQDPTWDLARMPWMVNTDQRPMAVLEAHDTDDVQAAVRWAVQHEVQVTAQPTGHGTTGAFEDMLLLRTKAIGGISVDLERRTATVGAGVQAGALLEALEGTGLTFLAGSNPDPSVVGMTVQGGISWFGRAYGIGADSIVSLEIVDGMGRLRQVDESDAELFWALRGSGGDFGIITKMELRLHPAPALYGGRLLWPVEQMGQVLRTFKAVTETAPEELSIWYHTYQFPPFPEIPEVIRGKAFASVAVAYLGSAEDGAALVAPFREIPGVVMDLMGEVPLSALGSIADEPTDPMPGLEMSRLLTSIDDDLVDRLEEAVGAGSASPLAIFQIRHLGGAFRQVIPGQSSFGPVDEEYSMFALVVPGPPGSDMAAAGIFARLDGITAPYASGRTFLSFLSHESTDRWWTPETRARLVAAKQVTDPLDVIRSNRPVNR